jgi:MFS family permease
MSNQSKNRFTPAVTVIIIFGIISMLGDAVYETARSANSQYLNLLTISATQVGLVFGIGEFLGYFLRLVAGFLSDKSGRYWLFMFLGYGMLLVVPLDKVRILGVN